MTDFDLLIVGAGTAGMPCALAAAGAGGRVLLVEKTDVVGGTLHLSAGHLAAAGTQRQRQHGIEDHPDLHFAEVMRISRGRARRDLVRRAVDLAPETLDWLDDHGFDFADDCPRIVHGHEPYDVARTVYGNDEARSILAVLAPLLELEERRGGVEVRLATEVEELLTDAAGAVVGARLRGPGGAAEVRAAATVLTCGGFGASPQRFAELHRRPLVSAARLSSTGDALVLTAGLDAAVTGEDCYIPTFGGLPAIDDPGRVQWHDRPRLVASERPPWEIYVGRSGERFVAEDEPSIHAKESALAALPDLTFFQVFDEIGIASSPEIVAGWTAGDLRRAAAERPGVFVGDTWQALAARAGIDAAGLVAAVESYNRAVATGDDPTFGRRHLPAALIKPPFYALQNHGITLITFAGLDVDEGLAVRRAGGGVIPGLYAAGEALGAAATCGKAFCGGMMLTPALSFGRWLGERLVRRP